MEAMMQAKDEDTAWHLDKKVPIAMVLTIVGQTFGLGWYASSISSRVSALEQASPAAVSEFTKLETARENTNIAVARIETKMDSLLSIARRLDTRSGRAPDSDGPPR